MRRENEKKRMPNQLFLSSVHLKIMFCVKLFEIFFSSNCYTASFFCTPFRKIIIIVPTFFCILPIIITICFLLDSKFRTPKNYRWHIWKRDDGSLIPRSEFLLGIVRVYYYFYYYYYKSELKMQKKPGFWVVPWAAQGIEAHHSDGAGRIFWFFGFWSLPPSLFFHIWWVFEKKIGSEHWIVVKFFIPNEFL